MNKIVKKKQILDWLESGKFLTSSMAVQLFGEFDLPKVISQLKRKGADISSEYDVEYGHAIKKYYIKK